MGFSKSTKTNKDFIVINPPYKGGLHIQIFNKAFEELNDGGTLICLHPSTPFINRKPTKDDGKTQKIKDIVSKYKTRLTLVDGIKINQANIHNWQKNISIVPQIIFLTNTSILSNIAIAVDENEYGKPVMDKWHIKKKTDYLPK